MQQLIDLHAMLDQVHIIACAWHVHGMCTAHARHVHLHGIDLHARLDPNP